MRPLYYFFLGFLSLILQLTLAPYLSINNITPDFTLVFAVTVALLEGRMWGVISGFLIGLTMDIFGTGFVGVSSLTNSIAAYFAGFFGGEHFEKRTGTLLILFFITFLIRDTLYYIVTSLGSRVSVLKMFFIITLPQSLYSLMVAAVLLLFWQKFLRPDKEYYLE